MNRLECRFAQSSYAWIRSAFCKKFFIFASLASSSLSYRTQLSLEHFKRLNVEDGHVFNSTSHRLAFLPARNVGLRMQRPFSRLAGSSIYPQQGAARTAVPPHMSDINMEVDTFSELVPSLPLSVSEALASRNVHVPTAIQKASMTRAHRGESLVLHAETGSGKSLAFLLPTLARLGHAGATQIQEGAGKVLVVAPTRELAVQLANDAALIMPAPGAIQIITVGAIPEGRALVQAAMVVCTAPELLKLLESEGDTMGPMTWFVQQVKVLILDELDTLLPVENTYGPRASKKKMKTSYKGGRETKEPAENLLQQVMTAASDPDLQVIAASATASRPTRLKLARVLRRDVLGRWHDKPPAMVRPYDSTEDLTKKPRAIVIPSGVKHYYMQLPPDIKLKRLAPALPKAKLPSKMTLKQKRAAKQMAQRMARGIPQPGEIHPLLTKLQLAVEKIKPASALVFLCRSSGLTVTEAVRQLSELGLSAVPLHEAIGLDETLAPADQPGHGPGNDTVVVLQKRHRALADMFSNRQGDMVGSSEDAALVVTFEDMARGLHFDAVDTVFILGMPDSPATYLHLAGRTGRQPVLEGNVVTICPRSSHEQLLGWSSRLGGINIERLELLDKEVFPKQRLH